MIERKQNIRISNKRKLATNWTLSGNTIDGGIHIIGSANLCEGCGLETSPFEDGRCSSCGTI